MSRCKSPLPYDTSKSYQKIVDLIMKQSNETILEPEAHEAARNLIGFCRTLLDIHAQLTHNKGHEKRD